MSEETRQEPEADYEFSETRQEKLVYLKNEETQTRTPYLLIEMMGDGVEEWMKYRYEMTVKTGRGGKPEMRDPNFKDFAATLISKCLHDKDRKPVPIERVRTFPASTLNGLFAACQKMNNLDGEEGKKD